MAFSHGLQLLLVLAQLFFACSCTKVPQSLASHIANMLAIQTAQAVPVYSKASLFRRFTKRDSPLVISSPIMAAQSPPASPLSASPPSPRKFRRSLPRISETAPTLPPFKPTHTRVDSGTFADLPISLEFSRPSTPPRSHSSQSSRSSSSSSSSTSSTSTSSTSTARSPSPYRASRTQHPHPPFPHPTLITPTTIFLPPLHIAALYAGCTPSASAPWFIYSEGPDASGKLKVHFHRARTGVKVAELFVVVDLRGEGAGMGVGVRWDGVWGVQAEEVVRGACWEGLGVWLEGGC
ncbi:hypothetical protein C7974DRAFT_373425 [Boeremia exigua]|uniref:uncharacterized protein n=1 Tax=Boeremia exigua TaxID=749465 RepID=UPI001E8D281B|nr:uncharacterized protein C7974DRAFT_373425 [Boeremia exigua]KAH6639153.1 hypothetical protein C7974DRAFT_373425 [Boeremia exigua]